MYCPYKKNGGGSETKKRRKKGDTKREKKIGEEKIILKLVFPEDQDSEMKQNHTQHRPSINALQ